MIDEENFNIEEVEKNDIANMNEQSFKFFVRNLNPKERVVLLSKLFYFIKDYEELMVEKYKYISWDALENEYYKDKNILRRYILIKAFITQNRICDDRQCFTNLNLEKIARRIDTLPCHDLESGKEYYGEHSTNYEDFVEVIEECSLELTEKFQTIHRIYALKIAKEHNKELAHKRRIEIVEIMEDKGVPASFALGKDVDEGIRDDENILKAGDPELLKSNGIFKKTE